VISRTVPNWRLLTAGFSSTRSAPTILRRRGIDAELLLRLGGDHNVPRVAVLADDPAHLDLRQLHGQF
jgi:hypothetical protein